MLRREPYSARMAARRDNYGDDGDASPWRTLEELPEDVVTQILSYVGFLTMKQSKQMYPRTAWVFACLSSSSLARAERMTATVNKLQAEEREAVEERRKRQAQDELLSEFAHDLRFRPG